MVDSLKQGQSTNNALVDWRSILQAFIKRYQLQTTIKPSEKLIFVLTKLNDIFKDYYKFLFWFLIWLWREESCSEGFPRNKLSWNGFQGIKEMVYSAEFLKNIFSRILNLTSFLIWIWLDRSSHEAFSWNNLSWNKYQRLTFNNNNNNIIKTTIEIIKYFF